MTTFITEQKITALANQYRIYDTRDDGKKNQLIAFVHQKRFAFKEEFSFYHDEAKSQVAFSVKAEKVMDIHGKLLVRNNKGNVIGAIKKAFGSSILRSTWQILDNEGSPVVVVQEKSAGVAIFRRLWELIPLWGDIPFLFKYHFVFVDPANNKVLANYQKTTYFRDHYRLDIHDEQLLDKVGKETLITQAMVLDALQGR